MPEYLAPGVYVEETSFRSKSIEGVGTSTCAFAGPTRKGPAGTAPELLTSFADFERMFGGIEDLAFDDSAAHNRNYVAHAARAFFNNGGGRLYVSRAVSEDATAAHSRADPVLAAAEDDDPDPRAWWEARFAGAHFNGATVTVSQVATPTGSSGLSGAPDGSLVRVHRRDDAASMVGLFEKIDGAWTAVGEVDADDPTIADLGADFDPVDFSAVMLSFNVVLAAGGDDAAYEGLALGPMHPQYIGSVLTTEPGRRADRLSQPIALRTAGAAPTLEELLTAFGGGALDDGAEPSVSYALAGGDDGALPGVDAYTDALDILVGLEDVSVVAAPGYSAQADVDGGVPYRGIQDALLTHVADPRRYRMAVLDAPPEVTPTEMRDLRGLVDSTRGALYYPWVVIANPLAGPASAQPAEVALPPSGFVCGIYARNDIERGVHKAPANEVVRGALRFQPPVNFGQQELLNPIGVNCLRAMSGRGPRVWGARTISSDPEWKYLNVRRYFNYLGASIDRGTQWAVFEPNGEALWANVRGTIADFLYVEWRNGALLGSKPEEAFFVRCDRTTMAQNDLDNGRLICLVGVAVVKPAEFVIFRIGQKTADAKA